MELYRKPEPNPDGSLLQCKVNFKKISLKFKDRIYC